MSVVFWRPLRALTRRQVRLGVGARRPLRGGPAAADGRPRPHRGLTIGVHHRHLRRADAGARRGAAAGAAAALDLGRGRAVQHRAGRPVAAGARHGLRRDGDLRVGGRLRPAHHRPGPLVLPVRGGRALGAADDRHRRRLRRRRRTRRHRPALRDRRLGRGALHGARGRRPRDLGPDLGAVAPAGDPGGDRHDPRAGVRHRLRRGARRRVADAPDGRRRGARPRRDVRRRARRPPPRRHRRSRTRRPSCCTTRCEVGTGATPGRSSAPRARRRR